MAWTDEARRLDIKVNRTSWPGSSGYSTLYTSKRIQSCVWTEDANMLGTKRRLGDLTLRITNDFATGTGDRAGWRGPAMSAVQAEDPQALIGAVLEVGIKGDPSDSGYSLIGPVYKVDSVDASDDGATIHATGYDSCFDKTLEEVSGSTDYSRLTATTRPVTWCLNVMAACGWPRGNIQYENYTGYNAPLGTACQLDPDMTVADAVTGLLASSGRAYTVGHQTINIRRTALSSGQSTTYGYTQPYGWPTPVDSERYGLMVVHDPADGSSREVVLDSAVDGTLEVTVPYSAGMDLTELTEWARMRYADTLYSVEVAGRGAGWSAMGNVFARVARWTDGSATKEQSMLLQRVEHRYDGGYREALTGTLGNVVPVT